jgi:hypothetical protein
MSVGDTLYGLTYGFNSTNQAEFGYYYAGPNSTSNALTFGFYTNSNILRVNADQSVDIPFHNGTTGLKLGGTLITATAAELNYLDITTIGVAEANKALVLNASRNISNINNVSSTGVISTSFQNNTASLTSYQTWTNSLTTAMTVSLDMSSTAPRFGTISAHKFRLMSNGANQLFIQPSGNVSIGADTDVYKLDVNGSLNATSLYLGSTLVTATATKLNYVDVTAIGVAQASKALVVNANKELYEMGGLSFSPNQTNKVLIKKSDTGHGVYLYDTQNTVSNTPYPTLSMLCANQTSCTYFQMDCALATTPFSISYQDGSSFTSGLRISCNNTTQASNVNSNVMLAGRNGTIPYVVVNDQFNQLHLFPQGLAELNTSYVQNVIIGEELLIRKNLQIGTSQDNATTKLISALDGTQATGTKRYITLGKNNVSNSQGEIYFHYDSSASDASYLGFGQFGKADQLTIGGNGWVGINTNAPLAPLHVNSTTSISYGVPFNTVYRLRTDNGVTESATGPIAYATSAVFNGYIACTAMAMSSDKRLKENIRDVSFEHVDNFYRTMTPKTYNFKNNKSKIEYGFVAQEVVKAGYLDLISMIGNEDLKGVIDDPEVDIDGVQLCIDYQKITMFNTVMIRSLLDENKTIKAEVQELRDLVNKLVSKPALQKWAQKN